MSEKWTCNKAKITDTQMRAPLKKWVPKEQQSFGEKNFFVFIKI